MKTQCSKCFRNLGVNSRADIYEYIESRGPVNVTDTTKHTKLKQPTVSYHLKEMNESGLLKKILKGKEVFYSVNADCPHDGYKCIVSHSPVAINS